MKLKAVQWFALLLFLGSSARAGDVIINEIMYHPAPDTPEDTNREWIELRNKGVAAVNLTGWRLTKGVNFTFTNSIIPAGGYLVVAANLTSFRAQYPTVSNVVGNWDGILSNNGEEIELSDSDNNPQASVAYANEGNWAIRQRGPNDLGHQGWRWLAEHDGLGKSAELINPGVPQQYGQNWASSIPLGGTPGAANSVFNSDTAPLILEANHSPAVPKSTDSVTVTARILDEINGFLTVTLFYRVDANPQGNPFIPINMVDDGGHGDGALGDGVFGATIPVQPNGTVIEFYIQAQDGDLHTRTYPAATDVGQQVVNMLYQVDDSAYDPTLPGAQAIYRLIMTEIERVELNNIGLNVGGAADSDAEMNGTFVSVDSGATEIRYTCGFRNRGHGSRTRRPNNARVSIPDDNRWKSVRSINLNTAYTHAQVVGSDLFQKAGLPMANSRPVQVRINGANQAGAGNPQFGSYAHNEEIASEFADNHFPNDSGGNLYRGIRDDAGLYANLNYLGPDKNSYRGLYFKQNNISEDNWADLIDLTSTLTSTPNATYSNEVTRVMDVSEAMLYFAVNTLVDNNETSLSNGNGDDYAMYRRSSDGRFLILPYDTDTILGQGDSPGSVTASIFRMTQGPSPGPITRFVTWPDFIPIYYGHLKRLIDTTFSPAQLGQILDRAIGGYVTPGTVSSMKTWSAQRNAFVLSQIPLVFTITSPLPVLNGFPRSVTSTTSLNGSANVIDTRTVRVNGALATWNAVSGTWSIAGISLQPGINRVVVQALGLDGAEVSRGTIDIWYDDATVANLSGSLGSDTTLTAADGPYQITANLTVPNGVTLTIEPGTTVFVSAGVSINVTGTGRLLAVGSEAQHIRFTRVPGGANWGSLDFLNSTVESRLAYVDFDSCGGTSIGGHNAQLHVNDAIVFIDHGTWPSTPPIEYISFDGSSFIVQNCVFPTYPQPVVNPQNGQPEMLHGVNGIPAGGHGIFRDNFFGHTWGFNDTIDFTGGQRPGAILQIINNVFDGSGDDNLDLDSTDAWIEGNIFMHVHRDPARTDDARDTGSAISGGIDFANQFSEWTVINNLFYDVDHAVLNKGGGNPGGGRFIFVNNTLVHVAKESGAGLLSDIAAFDFTDDGVPLPDPSYGAGAYVAGNIIWDCPALTANYNPANHTVIFENNILPVPWPGPGSNNVVTDPHLNLALIANVATADWRTVKAALTPQPGSPALGSGLGGFDRGGLNPRGLLVFGEPVGTTASTSATLTVAPGGTFNWGTDPPVPPYLWGYTHYKWKLDNGPWSAETSITTTPTISLTGLSNGQHTVFVTGKSDACYYQDDPFVYTPTSGIPAHVTASRTWTVNPVAPGQVRLNEVLARNLGTLLQGEDFPDLIELHNSGGATINLAGLGLTDDPADPFKFAFPAGATLNAGAYLVVFAASPNGSPGHHLGFQLNQDGDSLFLYNTNGAVLDSITFGLQLPDLSIGRLADDTWALTLPTFGSANVAAPIDDVHTLKINEWLANGQSLFVDDYVELYNPATFPAPLGGLYLSDAPQGSPNLNQIAQLSFIAGHGFTAFTADGHADNGVDHLNFKLSPDQGQIALFDTNLNLIDCIFYGPQPGDVSEGRQPNGSSNLVFLSQPTRGGGNPGGGGMVTVSNFTVAIFPLVTTWKYEASGTDLLTAWRNTIYDDSLWSSGPSLFYHGTGTGFGVPINTVLPFTSPNIQRTFYFRTHFNYTGPTNGVNLVINHVLDDGAVFWINGAELGRYNMPGGTIFYSTFSSGTINGDAILQGPFSFAVTNLVVGDNVIAVEVHQASTTSSDIAFAMSLDAVVSTTNITAVTQPVLNEVMANNVSVATIGGSLSDYVELANPFDAALDLSDMSLTDKANNQRRWVFPAGASIPARGYLVVLFESTNAPSLTNGPVLNTGFGLNSSGDAVFLYDALSRGGGLVDGIAFGLQVADLPIGRIPNLTGPWRLNLPTPGAANIVASLGPAGALRINEWLANPSSGGDDFFELYNPNPQPVSLGGLHLTDDLNDKGQFTIAPLSFIAAAPDGFVEFIADGKPNNGPNHVNFKLSSDGDSIGLSAANLTLIDAVTFGLQDDGVSEGRFPDGSTNIARFPGTSTPGASNLRPLTDVVVNEVLTHTDLPFEDAIELHNPGPNAIDISGWFLSDSKNDPLRFRIPDGTVIQAGGFAVFYEKDFNPFPGVLPSFSLSSAHGDDVFLSTADAFGNPTGFRGSVKFGAAENAVSLGRYETSVGVDFTALSQLSFGTAVAPGDPTNQITVFRTGRGATNAYPKVGPVVVNEIMYHPPDINGTNDNSVEEFIELLNITGSPVPLFDPNAPTNTWRLRDAVDFDFPTNVTLPAGGFLLVVNFNPATNAAQSNAFRVKFSVPAGVPILGPYGGKLDNGSDSVELYKPDPPQAPGSSDAGFVPFVLVDKVNYSDSAPWASAADGSTNGIGVSLQRVVASNYGNDPVNWIAGNPTAGAASGPALLTPPSISVQPLSRVVPVGSNVTFTVTAAGSPTLRYQWRFNGSVISKATNSTLVVTNVQLAGAGRYTVLVNNTVGAAGSTPTILTVQAPPVITSQPQSRTVAFGATVTFSVGASGTAPLSFQWMKDGTNLLGATGPSLTISNVQAANEGNYTVTVSNFLNTATSLPANLSISAAPTIVIGPQNTNVFVGANVTLTVLASGSQPLRYQWRFNNSPIANATNASLTLTSVTTGNSGNYTVLVTNTVGGAIGGPATVSVTVPPSVTLTATDTTASEPGANTGAFRISRSGNTIQPLTVNITVGGTASNGVDYVLLTSPVTIPAGASLLPVIVTPIDDLVLEGNETVVLSLAPGPDYIVSGSGTATVTIFDNDNQAPTVNITDPADGSFYTAPVNVPITAVAMDTDGLVAKIELFYRGTNKIGEIIGTAGTFVWTNAVPGTNVLTAVATDNLGSTGVSPPVTITVNGLPTVSISSPANNATFATPANITINANANDADGGITQVEFFSDTNSLGVDLTSPYSIVFSNVTVGTYTLTAVATDNRGATTVSAPVVVNVVVPPPGFADLFANRSLLTAFTNFITGSNNAAGAEAGEPNHYPTSPGGRRSVWLSWTAPASGTATMDTFGSAFDTVLAVYTNNPPGSPFVTNLVRVANSDDDSGTLQSRVQFSAIAGVTYQIAVDGYSFSANNFGNITFHLNLPNPLPVITTQPVSATVNVGVNATFSVAAGGPGPLSYQWRFNNANLPGATNTSYLVTGAQIANAGPYVVVVSNPSGSVTSAVATLTVRVRPVITAQPPSQIVNPGDVVTFNVTATGAAPLNFQWRFNGGIISGANASSYVLGNVQPTNAGNYTVTVGNSVGSTNSDVAVLIVRPRLISMAPTNGYMRFTLLATPGLNYAIESSSYLTNWTTVTNMSNVALQSAFTEPAPTGSSNRFYRARLVP